MSIGEDQTECPLCMEPLEMDDINFFPCTCGYQICRFCWHRIRTDENGLCPACRKCGCDVIATRIPLGSSSDRVLFLPAPMALGMFYGERRPPPPLPPPAAREPSAFGRWGEDPDVIQQHCDAGFFSRPPPFSSSSMSSASSSARFFPYSSTAPSTSSCVSTCLASPPRPLPVNYSVFGPPQFYQQYPEDPAEFKPLTEEELQRIKRERRQKEAQRKQKAAESRRHLANVRVVQKNLVFVVGLSQRLADHEALKKHEYFGKFGKIHKVVINQSTSYAGSQGPSASAYVTYHKPEDALRAIQAVNNIHVDGRTLKASLGTTKYCSHFLRGTQCPKPDCMYLHELGEEAASFTKEEMQQGKHQEYEQKLMENFLNSQNISQLPIASTKSTTASSKKSCSPTASPEPDADSPLGLSADQQPSPTASLSKEPWPPLLSDSPLHRMNGKASTELDLASSSSSSAEDLLCGSSTKDDKGLSPLSTSSKSSSRPSSPRGASPSPPPPLALPSQAPPLLNGTSAPASLTAAMANTLMQRKGLFEADSLSLFSDSGFNRLQQQQQQQPPTLSTGRVSHAEIPDTIAVSSSTDWQAAFGFKPHPASSAPPVSSASSSSCNHSNISDSQDDDLGFDPWNESSKALADLIEKEATPGGHGMHHHPRPAPGLHQPAHSNLLLHKNPLLQHHQQPGGMHYQTNPSEQNRVKSLPPGFTHPFSNSQPPMSEGSRLMGLMQLSAAAAAMHPAPQQMPAHHHHARSSPFGSGSGATSVLPEAGNAGANGSYCPQQQQQQDWQEGLRALLPNINISFGGSTAAPHPGGQRGQAMPSARVPPREPASQNKATHIHDDVMPHWMASLQQLTDEPPASSSSSRLPLFQQLQMRNTAAAAASGASSNGWSVSNPTGPPPPGFQQTTSSSANRTEAHQLAEGL
ncbi:hypothetical protein CAPTEDRAFT_223184 [Capitella teleta]|uniref:CCR4-NOT transcription complex subunit 4 n=1 Tax=Capitella teleta TaxID=283909 RepID=R7T3W0_CAPTE|nr:hypothetical protein CAPTEDRAFT_223184 [Capitella teleta]|eukprot:ELT87458.1 hypothetical protein CAPTEDRAFT_223184 [Capitella teleta]